jgi:hypothetical protein
MSVTETLVRPLLRGDRSRPLITHYDDAAGTRVELSVATLANWAAKTANWLVEEFDVEPGTPVAVTLPAHWQTAGILLGAWWAGAHIVTTTAPETPVQGMYTRNDPDSDFVRRMQRSAGAGNLVQPAVTLTTVDNPGPGPWAAVSLDPMGMGLRGNPPEGALDFIAESRMFGDDFMAMTDVPGDTPALAGLSVDEVVNAAREQAVSARVLSTLDWTFPAGVIAGLLGVLAGGGSLVQVTNPDPAKMAAHQESERATEVLDA